MLSSALWSEHMLDCSPQNIISKALDGPDMLLTPKSSGVQYYSESRVARLMYEISCPEPSDCSRSTPNTVDVGVAVHEERTQTLTGATVGVPRPAGTKRAGPEPSVRAGQTRARPWLPQLRGVNPERLKTGVPQVGQRKGRWPGCHAAKPPE